MSSILQRIFPPVAGVVTTTPQSDQQNCKDGLGCETTDEPAIKPAPSALTCNLPGDLRVMIRGTSNSYNTALLFQCAVSCAMEGQVVVFITHERFSSLPVSVEGACQPDPVLMKQVHIKYFVDRPSFLRELARIHTSNPMPDVIIVDSLDYYTSNPKSNDVGQATASVCAHLVDAAAFIHNKRSKTDPSSSSSILPCLLVSVTTPSPNSLPQCHDVYTKFFSTTFFITDLEDTKMKQLQCWSKSEELPQYVVTFEVGDTIKVVDVMVGAELDADWSQTSSMVT